MVERLLQHYKVKGLGPVTATFTGIEQMGKMGKKSFEEVFFSSKDKKLVIVDYNKNFFKTFLV